MGGRGLPSMAALRGGRGGGRKFKSLPENVRKSKIKSQLCRRLVIWDRKQIMALLQASVPDTLRSGSGSCSPTPPDPEGR